jgi:hypothetical protein
VEQLMADCEYHERLRMEWFLLYELTKNGCIDSFTADHLQELNKLEAKTQQKAGDVNNP